MLDNHPKLKHFLHYLLIHPYSARTRLWARIFVTPFTIKRGRGSIIRRTVRLDLIPSKQLVVGRRAIIEDNALINNGMGDVIIGDHSMILSRSKVVGPVTIGKYVIVSSGSHITGLTHNFEDIDTPIQLQGVTANLTTIEDDVWIGGNAAINQGVTIGRHSVVGTGSVVTKDIPPYSVAVGNPARVIKRYDFEKKEWVKVINK